MVPYKGMLFTIKGNALLALGSGSGPAPGNLGLVPSSAPSLNSPALSDEELLARLKKEIIKIIADNQLLKPGYQDDSQFTAHYAAMDNYFDNPGDTLYTLSVAYAHLADSDPQKAQLKTYLDTIIYPTYFKDGITTCIGWDRGAQRDSIPYPPDLVADMQTLSDNYCGGGINPNNFYALFRYAQDVSLEKIQEIYSLAVDTGFPEDTDDADYIKYPYKLNAAIAGYYGFLRLYELADQPPADVALRDQAIAAHDRLIKLRLDHFSKDTPFNGADGYGQNFLNISRNFIWLTPELAAELNLNKLSEVQEAIQEYNTIAPYWFVSRFNAAAAESGLQNLYDYPAIFQAKAWILKESRAELSKYLDVPAFERGDLFYIQNLVASMEAQ
jgi:hypothetical protein